MTCGHRKMGVASQIWHSANRCNWNLVKWCPAVNCTNGSNSLTQFSQSLKHTYISIHTITLIWVYIKSLATSPMYISSMCSTIFTEVMESMAAWYQSSALEADYYRQRSQNNHKAMALDPRTHRPFNEQKQSAPVSYVLVLTVVWPRSSRHIQTRQAFRPSWIGCPPPASDPWQGFPCSSMHVRKIGKAWLIWWCNVDVSATISTNHGRNGIIITYNNNQIDQAFLIFLTCIVIVMYSILHVHIHVVT